jgi:hypothetical protein
MAKMGIPKQNFPQKINVPMRENHCPGNPKKILEAQ